MSFFNAIESYALEVNRALSPDWNLHLEEPSLRSGPDVINILHQELGWELHNIVEGKPRPDQFPLICYDKYRGWTVVLQWASEHSMVAKGQTDLLEFNDDQTFFILSVPDPLQEEPETALKVFLSAIKKRKSSLVLAGIATVFANLLALAVSFYAMQLYDRVIPLGAFETLFVLTVGVLFALALDLVLRSLRAVIIDVEAQNIDREVSEYFFARTQAIRLDARPKMIGTLASHLQGQDQIRQVLSSGSLFVLADLPFAVLFLLVIASIGGTLAIVPLVSLPIAVLFGLILARIIRESSSRALASGNQKNGQIVEMLEAAETLKANRGGWFILSRWNRLLSDIQYYDYPVKKASAVAGTIFSTLQQATYVAVMCYGAYLASKAQLTTGALLACSILVGRINGPLVAQLPSLIVQWGYARFALEMLNNILRLPLEASKSRGGLRPSNLNGPIDVSGLTFRYGDNENIIGIDNLKISPGERVAIIGPVGSGKSTLLKILAGLYKPSTGKVTISGIDLFKLAEDITRQHIGYLPQDVRMLRGNLRENLTMGLGGIEDNALLNIARKTRLNTLFEGQSEGFETRIHEGGAGLSGGQRSLVGINRLIHSSPSVWILDEPTASLDLASEVAVLETLDKAIRVDDIFIMATHKVSLLERFNRVLIVKEGRIIKDAPSKSVIEEMQKISNSASLVTTRLKRRNVS